jgi:hypothetical protein
MGLGLCLSGLIQAIYGLFFLYDFGSFWERGSTRVPKKIFSKI